MTQTSTDARITIEDETGIIAATTFGAFLSDNEGLDEAGITEDLRELGFASIGGGAAPEFVIHLCMAMDRPA